MVYEQNVNDGPIDLKHLDIPNEANQNIPAI